MVERQNQVAAGLPAAAGDPGTAGVPRPDGSTRRAADRGVILHLLDSTREQPLQTWQFTDRTEITIGRSDGNDVVVIDPHVSRQHVKLVEQNGSWRLFSMGRHGTLIGSQPVAEFSLNHRAVFRLGPLGPMMRFENGMAAAGESPL